MGTTNMVQTLEATTTYEERFTAMEGGPQWLTTLRERGMTTFSEIGFPTIRDEEWRFTNVTDITKLEFNPCLTPAESAPESPESIDSFFFEEITGPRLVFINGHFNDALSSMSDLPKGARVLSMKAALASDDETVKEHLSKSLDTGYSGFTALNTAFIQDGTFVFVPDNTVLEQPIHILYVSNSTPKTNAQTIRNLFVAGKSSEYGIIEQYVGLTDQPYFTNTVTEAVLGDNATIHHAKIQLETDATYHVGTTQTTMARDAHYHSHAVSLGAKLMRNDINNLLEGEGSTVTLNGLYLTDGTQHTDTHTVIDHAVPHCPSNELYAGILGGKSRAVFNGKIIVREDAQKTSAFQTNRCLVLSDDATIDTNPQLEIFADDVRCTHGATIGQLDADSLFYLRSRGLNEGEARKTLIYAFAAEIIGRIPWEPVRNYLNGPIEDQIRAYISDGSNGSSGS